jgi:thiol:disulfide interchange protein DsbC
MRFALCLLFVVLLGVQPVFADESEKEAAAQLSRIMPNTMIDGFGPSPIPELYEVTAGDQIFYFSPNGHLVFGEIWSKDGRSLTAERRDQLITDKLGRLPLDKALTIGDGPHQVIEFTDPDCPFCRKADAFLEGRADVTRHIFFFPLEGLHPKAAAKSRYILCSEDKEKALKEVFAGDWDNKDLPPLAADCQETLLDEHLRLGGTLGVRGTPTIWVDGASIKGADLDAIAALLNNPSNERRRSP